MCPKLAKLILLISMLSGGSCFAAIKEPTPGALCQTPGELYAPLLAKKSAPAKTEKDTQGTLGETPGIIPYILAVIPQLFSVKIVSDTPRGAPESQHRTSAVDKLDISQRDPAKVENKVSKYPFSITPWNTLTAAVGAALPFIAFTNFSTHKDWRVGLAAASLLGSVFSTCIWECAQRRENNLPEGQTSKQIHRDSFMSHYFFATVTTALLWLKIPKQRTLF